MEAAILRQVFGGIHIAVNCDGLTCCQPGGDTGRTEIAAGQTRKLPWPKIHHVRLAPELDLIVSVSNIVPGRGCQCPPVPAGTTWEGPIQALI